jgi:hypothetical protein
VASRPFVPGSGYFRQWAVMIERRRAVRTKVFLAAQIHTARRPPLVINCVVRDVSHLGARLELSDTSALPNIFELTFDSGRTLRACHVVWRTPTVVGVEFSPSLQQPTNDDTAWTGNRSIYCYFSLNSEKQFSPHFSRKSPHRFGLPRLLLRLPSMLGTLVERHWRV